LLLYVNAPNASRVMLLDAMMQAYALGPGATRMLIHTDRDNGHECAEFQLLDLTRRWWARYSWVVYCSGPDEFLTPSAVEHMQTLLSGASGTAATAGERAVLHAFPFPRPSPPPQICGFMGNASRCYRMSRHALDVFAFRPSGGFLIGKRASGSIWANASAMCIAHRPYQGLPETVLWWLRVTWGLRVNSIGPQPPRRACKNGDASDMSVGPCEYPRQPPGSAGVWHTHNLTAVHMWLDLETRARDGSVGHGR
jgi:hypothetical protein